MKAEPGHCRCGEKIDPEQDYQKITGWERRRSQGGTNAVKLRTPEGIWMCRWCVAKLSKGFSVGQESLL